MTPIEQGPLLNFAVDDLDVEAAELAARGLDLDEIQQLKQRRSDCQHHRPRRQQDYLRRRFPSRLLSTAVDQVTCPETPGLSLTHCGTSGTQIPERLTSVSPWDLWSFFQSMSDRLADFYEAVLGVTPTNDGSGDIRLRNDREEVLVHSVPAGVARPSPSSPHQKPEIDPRSSRSSMSTRSDAALEAVERNRGVVTGRTFTVEGLTRHDVLDPDGNVIQLRSPTFLTPRPEIAFTE